MCASGLWPSMLSEDFLAGLQSTTASSHAACEGVNACKADKASECTDFYINLPTSRFRSNNMYNTTSWHPPKIMTSPLKSCKPR